MLPGSFALLEVRNGDGGAGYLGAKEGGNAGHRTMWH